MQQFIDAIRDIATVVTPTVKLKVVTKDPDDDMLFECAVAADAQLIVSADKAVLECGPFIHDGRSVGVCHPRDLKSIFAQDLRYA